jgi:hypothetical protein
VLLLTLTKKEIQMSHKGTWLWLHIHRYKARPLPLLLLWLSIQSNPPIPGSLPTSIHQQIILFDVRGSHLITSQKAAKNPPRPFINKIGASEDNGRKSSFFIQCINTKQCKWGMAFVFWLLLLGGIFPDTTRHHDERFPMSIEHSPHPTSKSFYINKSPLLISVSMIF